MTTFPFRILLKASWGIAIDVTATASYAPTMPEHATPITSTIGLQLREGLILPDEDIEFFAHGLRRVAREIEAAAEGRVTVVDLASLQYNPTDYQLEGVEAAAIGWAAESLDFEPPEIDITFDREAKRYVFAYS